VIYSLASILLRRACCAMLTCQNQHPLQKVAGLGWWQGHIHPRECASCGNAIDRHKMHYACSEKCHYDLCRSCYETKQRRAQPTPKPKPKPRPQPEPIPDQPKPEPRPDLMRRKTQEFMESSWQHSSETAFWVVLQLGGIYVGMANLEYLTTEQELHFPLPYLTACLSNLTSGVVVICIQSVMMKLASGEGLSELSHGVDANWKAAAVLGVLVTLSLGAAAKVLSNEHHTLASHLYMITPVATVIAASHPRVGMEEKQKEIVLAAAVASVGGMLAVRGPAPSLQGVLVLGWACLAVAFTVGQSLLTQLVMSPALGGKPATLVVCKSMFFAGASVGVEVSLLYEWHGFWSLPWLLTERVLGLICIIGLCNALVIIAHTRLIQITSATFASLLVPFQIVVMVPLQFHILPPVTDILGFLMCASSAVAYFKWRKDFPETAVVGYSILPGK